MHVCKCVLTRFDSVPPTTATNGTVNKRDWTANNDRYASVDPRLWLSTEYDGEILFTYDVTWDVTTMPWTQRWVGWV